MQETEADHRKIPDKVNNNVPNQEANKNTKNTNNDPLVLSQRNNQKLNSIIEEVRHLLELNDE